MKKIIVWITVGGVFLCMLLALSCKCKPSDIVTHWPDCSNHAGCGIVIPLPLAETLVKSISSYDLVITMPSWLSLNGISSYMTLVGTSKDLTGKATTTITFATGSQKIIPGHPEMIDIKPVLTKEAKDNLTTFFASLSPVEDVSVDVFFNLDTYTIKSVGDWVYEPTSVTISFLADGVALDTTTFATSLPDVFNSYLSSVINKIPDSAYKNNPDERRNALLDKLSAATNALKAHNAKGALQMLRNDIMKKFDGSNGGNQNDDWVTDPFAANDAYGAFDKVASLVAYIAGE